MPLFNKKVLGLTKNECNGCVMSEFVGLRSKMYAYLIKGVEMKRMKGVKGCVVKNHIKFNDYLDCLRNKTSVAISQNLIRSRLHNVYTVCEKKIALNAYDDKRYLQNNSTDTLPWGHKNIKENNYV